MRKLTWLALLPLAFLALFYFYPLGSILALSLAEGWRLALLQLLGDGAIHRVLGFTLWQASLSTALTLALGVPAAYLLAHYDFPGKRWLRAVSSIPFVLPTLVVAAAFNALLGPHGWVNQGLQALGMAPLEFINSFGAILVAHVFYNTTIVLRMVGDFWARLSPRSEQAARSLGASPWQLFTKVSLPMLAPALAAAALLVFIFNFTSFGVILVLGGPRFATLETEIFYQTVALFNLPAAALLALLQLLCTLALTSVYTRLAARLSRPLESRAAQLRPLSAQPQRWLSAAFLALLGLFFVAPLGGLAARSLTRLDTDRRQAAQAGITLDYYRALGEDPRNNLFFASPLRAIQTSLVYAGSTVVLALLVGLPASWLLAKPEPAKGPVRLMRWLDALLMLPLGTSALTLGLGFIVALDTPPLDLRASPLLVPLAHTLVALPFVVRSLVPALRSIRPRLRQAAALLGASPAEVVRRIDVPLVGRALVAAALFAFAISVGEFGASALIARPEYPTMPVLIYRLLAQPGAVTYGQAMALSTLLMLFTGAGMLLIERVRIAEVGEF